VKYQTAKFSDGIFTVNCPHCSNEVAVDESQLEQINTQLSGQYACPVESCGKDIEFPNAEEAAELKAPTASSTPKPTVEELAPAPAPEPATASTPQSAPAAAAQESAPTPAPSPPPQTNPAAKSTQPPSESPAPALEPLPLQKSPAFEYAADRREAKLDRGFHGSKGDTLEREAATAQRISMKTILHGDCVKDKKDTFDETVSKFLTELDEECLISVHPVQYTADEKKGTDFGVMILYKIMADED
jgi:hypothetical protein